MIIPENVFIKYKKIGFNENKKIVEYKNQLLNKIMKYKTY